MKGLIFNILSELSERAGCQDDAWEVALAGAAMGDAEYELEELQEARDRALAGSQDLQEGELTEALTEAEEAELEADEALEAEAFEMPYLEGEWGDSFRFLMRSAGPFSDSDWSHLPGTPVSFGKPERTSQPSGERTSFLPEADPTDPYFLLMLSLAKR